MTQPITSTEPFIGRLPSRSPETDRFWDACNRNVFLVQRCLGCGKTQYHYRALCAHCWSDELEDVEATGHGTIWTYSIVMRNRSVPFEAKVPYAVVLVELDEGVRVLGNLVDGDLDDLAIGKDVTLAFAIGDDGQHIPVFRLSAGSGS